MDGKATITFKAKIQELDNKKFIPVPKFTRKHCCMSEFRNHSVYGGYANSTLFSAILARIKRETVGNKLFLDDLPNYVSVDTSKFLAIITIKV